MVGPLRFVDRGSPLSPGAAVSGLVVVLLFGVNWESSYDDAVVVLCLIFDF